MKISRIISVSLILILLVTLLSGCTNTIPEPYMKVSEKEISLLSTVGQDVMLTVVIDNNDQEYTFEKKQYVSSLKDTVLKIDDIAGGLVLSEDSKIVDVSFETLGVSKGEIVVKIMLCVIWAACILGLLIMIDKIKR